MEKDKVKFQTVDEYIMQFPVEVQDTLQKFGKCHSALRKVDSSRFSLSLPGKFVIF